MSSRLSILRATLPVSAEIDLGYGVTNDTSIPAPPLASDPFQNDTRHDLVKAVAKVVLSKL